MSRGRSIEDATPRGVSAVAEPLGREGLERRMEQVAAALLPGPEPADERALEPRPISAAELVRRMQPFVGWN